MREKEGGRAGRAFVVVVASETAGEESEDEGGMLAGTRGMLIATLIAMAVVVAVAMTSSHVMH